MAICSLELMLLEKVFLFAWGVGAFYQRIYFNPKQVVVVVVVVYSHKS